MYLKLFPNKYKLLDDAYRGSGGFEDGSYLIPHPVENADKYSRRQDMSYYINYVKPLVDAHVNPIFKTSPSRENTSNTYSLFVKDVDGAGTSLTRFMKKAAIRAKLHGVEFIVMDMDNIDEDTIVTKKDVIENRLYPYLYLVSPDAVTQWLTDKFGKLIYFSYTIQNNSVDTEGNIVNETESCIWTLNTCKIVHGDNEKTFTNNLGMIPVVPLYGTLNDSDDLIPQSDFYPIARSNLTLYNACSELRERNRAQAFSLLTYPIGQDDDYDSGREGIETGTNDVLLYKSGGQQPAWITPPTDSSDIIQNEIDGIKREIYRMAEMQFATQEQVSNVSGLAKSYDNQQLYQTVSELAQGCQEAEYKIAKLFSIYMSEDMSNINIIYNQEFGIVDSTEVLTNATQALSLNISKSFNEEMKKQLIRAMTSNVDNSVTNKLLQDLDNDPTKGNPINEGERVKTVQPVARR